MTVVQTKTKCIPNSNFMIAVVLKVQPKTRDHTEGLIDLEWLYYELFTSHCMQKYHISTLVIVQLWIVMLLRGFMFLCNNCLYTKSRHRI